MRDAVNSADFVLLLFTKTYKTRFLGQEETGKGLGATWEGAIITQELYEQSARSMKFIPAVFGAEDLPHIPSPLSGHTYYVLATKEGYEKLYRRLTNQPSIQKPPLGRPRELAPLPIAAQYLPFQRRRGLRSDNAGGTQH
jgi:hypothetical protein